MQDADNNNFSQAAPRKPYAAPRVTYVPLMPEELFVADCVKTPSICRPRGAHQKIKS